MLTNFEIARISEEEIEDQLTSRLSQTPLLGFDLLTEWIIPDMEQHQDITG